MVLLVNVICALIFCMICHFSIGVAENESKNDMCAKKTCQEESNPFDITRNDAVSGLKDSHSYETNPGDMFRDIRGTPRIKKVSEVHDNGFYTSLCWIEITTITEIRNGSKTATREYAITFETPSDIPEKYISKKGDVANGDTIQYKIFDRDTKKSEVVNFTTVSEGKDSIVRQHRKVLCGSGPVYTKEFMEWPHSDRKRVEIRVSPKRQALVASDCSVPNANVENISTSSSTRRDFDGGITELLTREDADEDPTLKYPTSDHLNKTTPEYTEIQSPSTHGNKIEQTEPKVVYTETDIHGISSSPATYETLPPASTAEPEDHTLPEHSRHMKKSNFNLTHTPLLNPPINDRNQTEFMNNVSTSKEPESKVYQHLDATSNLISSENPSYTSTTKFRPGVTVTSPTIEIISEKNDSTIDFRTISAGNQTERYSDMHSTAAPPYTESKDTHQTLEDSDVPETLNDTELTTEFIKLPVHKISIIVNISSTTTRSDKNQQVEPEDSKLDNKLVATDSSKEHPDFTQNKDKVTKISNFASTVHWTHPSDYTPVTKTYERQGTPEEKSKWLSSKTSQEPQQSSLLPVTISDLPITEGNVVDEEGTRIPQTVTDGFDVTDTTIYVLNKTSILLSTPSKSPSLESTTKPPEFITYYVNSIATDPIIGNELSLSTENDNVITTEHSPITTRETTGKPTANNLQTKTESSSTIVSSNTFNTPATIQIRSEGISHLKSATSPAMEYHTKILKDVENDIPKENDEPDEYTKTHLRSSTIKSITATSTSDFQEKSTEILKGVEIGIPKEKNEPDEYTKTHLRSSTIKSITATSTSDFQEKSTEILKDVEIGIPKENDEPDEYTKTHLRSSTIKSITATSTSDFQEKSTVNRHELDNISPDGFWSTSPLVPLSENSSKINISLPGSLDSASENLGDTDYTTLKVPNASRSPPRTTESEQAVQIISQLPYTVNVLSSKGLLDPTQAVTEDFEIVKPKVKPSRKPDDDSNISSRIPSVGLPNESNYTNENGLEPESTDSPFSHPSQNSTTDSTDLSDAKDNTNSKVVKERPTVTEFSITSSQKYTTENNIKKGSQKLMDGFKSTTTSVSLQPVHTTKVFADFTTNHTPVYQATTLNDSTNSLFYLPDEDATANLLDEIRDMEMDSSSPRTASKNPSKHIFLKSTAGTVPGVNSALNDFGSSTERVGLEQNTSTVSSDSIGHVSTPKKLSNVSLELLPNEPQSNFTKSVTVSENLPNQLENMTVGKTLLDVSESTTSSLQNLTHTILEVSLKPVSSYTKSREEHPKILLNPDEIRNSISLFLTSSVLPSTAKYVSLKPTHQFYSNTPTTHPKSADVTERFISTTPSSDQFKVSTGTFNSSSEMRSGSTTLEPVMSQLQSTTEDLDLGQNFHSMLPSTHFKPSTSAESLASEKLFQKYESTPQYVPSSRKVYSASPIINPTGISSIADNLSSDTPVDVFHSTPKHANTQQKPAITDKDLNDDTLSTRSFTSPERLHNNTIEDMQIIPNVSSELPVENATSFLITTENSTPSDKSLKEFQGTTHKDSNNKFTVGVTSTEILPLNSIQTTSIRTQHYLERPSPHINNSVLMEIPADSDTASDEFEGTTELLEEKLTSNIHYTTTVNDSPSSEKLLELFQTTTDNVKEEDPSYFSKTEFNYPSGRFSTDDVTPRVTTLDQSQNSPKLQFKPKYSTDGLSSTTSRTLATTTQMLPLSSVIQQDDGYKRNSTSSDDVDKYLTNNTKTTNFDLLVSNNAEESTQSSTDNLAHILKRLNKALCNSTKHKILVKVKILMEHVFENNESGAIRKLVIPIMGIGKNAEFDIKPKQRLPTIPHKKLNEDWNLFLEDLATNFFNFNREAVPDYTELKQQPLNVNVPGYEFRGDSLTPEESIQRMYRIHNSMNRCKKKHGNKAPRRVSISQLTLDKNSTPYRSKYTVDDVNRELNLELTTHSQEDVTTDFYRFLLGPSSKSRKLQVDNKPMKIVIPTKLLLPLTERSKMKMITALNDWPRKTNIILRNKELTPIPGSYRVGYKQFSISDLFPISAISERNQYIPTILYHGAPTTEPEISKSYSSANNYDLYNVLSSRNPRFSIDIAPRVVEYSVRANNNSQYAISASSGPNNVADFETTTAKTFKDNNKTNLRKSHIKEIDAANMVHINKENLNSTIDIFSSSVTEETNNSSSQSSHNVNLYGNPHNSGSEKVNLKPVTENYKSEQSKQRTFLDFRNILDGILSKLNALLEKLSKR